MLCAQVTDPEMYMFMQSFVNLIGTPQYLEATAENLIVIWELGNMNCVMGLSVCGCCLVTYKNLQRPGSLWNYKSQWKPHIDACLTYHAPISGALN
jgi:hypothetical protein